MITVDNEDLILSERADEALATGLTCQPADRAEAEAGVLTAYERAGLPAPELLLWFDSPEAGARAVAMLRLGVSGGPDAQRVLAALRAQGAEPGRTELGSSVRPKLRTRPWGLARAALLARLGGPGFARHWVATGARPWRQLIDQLATPLRNRLTAQFTAEAEAHRKAQQPDAGQQESLALAEASRDALLDVILGQQEAAWLGAFDQRSPELAGLARVARAAGWWWAFERVVVLCERPVAVFRDNLGRLHHGDGPALSFPDGFGVHVWRGMPIPPEVASQLRDLTVEQIQAEDNAEVRRVMLEHFGYDRYLRESKAHKSHSDKYGTLWRIVLPGDEPLVMVEVQNATPEPDGTVRTYFLRVPPNTRTAHEGVAWTFGVTAEEYQPLAQS